MDLPPTLDNPIGEGMNISTAFVFIVMTVVVFLRLWGRYRYKTPVSSFWPSYGETRFWILMSDLVICVSWVTAVVLSAVIFSATRWGQGIHQAQLTVPQAQRVLEFFFIYQVVYKFASGISKIATCLLFLAIVSKQMVQFQRVCKAMVLFISSYCIATSIATVFQCGTNFDSNWIMSHDQSQCFFKPPFWYAHAALNIIASLIMVGLPWWLFSSIIYKRKWGIASMLSLLALAEVILGCVRLEGLYISSHSNGDMTFGTSTGIIVSQLEVDFACISACIPTVFKLVEDLYRSFCVHVLHMDMSLRSKTTSKGSPYRNDASTDKAQPSGPYTNFSSSRDEMEFDEMYYEPKGKIKMKGDIVDSSEPRLE